MSLFFVVFFLLIIIPSTYIFLPLGGKGMHMLHATCACQVYLCMIDTCLCVTGPHKFSFSVSVRIFQVCVLMDGILHGRDLGLTSLSKNVVSLLILSNTQDPYPHWLRGRDLDGAPAGIRTPDLWYGRRAHYRWATDPSPPGPVSDLSPAVCLASTFPASLYCLLQDFFWQHYVWLTNSPSYFCSAPILPLISPLLNTFIFSMG